LDVVGYNYLDHLYGKSHEVYPERVICGTESFPRMIDEIWANVEKFPHVIGDFTWTSHDYLGEAGVGKATYLPEPPGNDVMLGFRSPYPWRTANNGDFDLCGFDRPQLHYRKIVWGSEETYLAVRNPRHHGLYENLSQWGWPAVRNDWTWNGFENMPVAIDVYSAAEEVELIVNGITVGRKPAGKANRFKTRFETTYIPGVIEAISYTGGKEISRDTLCTAGKAASIRLSPDRGMISADGLDLSFVTVEVVDEKGMRVQDAEITMEAYVQGNGTLAAFGSANPVAIENYTKGEFTSYEGRLLAIIRAEREKGTATLVVKAQGFGEARVEIPVG
jgi:beta-galactosidase